jgi:hypothetical protein
MSICRYVKDHGLRAAFVLTCCGSATRATVRLSGHSGHNPEPVQIRGFFNLNDDIRDHLLFSLVLKNLAVHVHCTRGFNCTVHM